MKKSFLPFTLTITAALILFAFSHKPDKTDFSGEWKLNETKSELGQFAPFASRTIKAAQKSDSISISRTSTGFDGNEQTSVETLSFDGRESESMRFGNSKKLCSAKWSDDGQTLNMTYTLYLEFNGETTEIKGTETWALSDDGKTLTTQINSSSSFGDVSAKAVYEKQ